MSEPTQADVRALQEHLRCRTIRCQCGTANFVFSRIALLYDAGPEHHLSPVRGESEEATPIAVITCRECLEIKTFSWLPILDRARASSPTELARVGGELLSQLHHL